MALPVELRLEVYDHCSPFSLLQLSRTSSSISSEIDRHRNTIGSARWFCDNPSTVTSSTAVNRCITLRKVRRVSNTMEYMLFRRLFPNSRETGRYDVDCCGMCYGVVPGVLMQSLKAIEHLTYSSNIGEELDPHVCAQCWRSEEQEHLEVRRLERAARKRRRRIAGRYFEKDEAERQYLLIGSGLGSN
ncbi:hypothetical protein BJ508DRAFT_109466 [Ascobolus immersus RN42]|uniref:F-box domain-containing protein n=1 Tax=Ascobolus immersus RN42 TaxID=1160509 RepID=A0A3N4I6G3_ASCIM|nr:hypothetical protein BJ508DRAFT_109466 [Ascobolus immersus RN42]